jgi:hypothetical protein
VAGCFEENVPAAGAAGTSRPRVSSPAMGYDESQIWVMSYCSLKGR